MSRMNISLYLFEVFKSKYLESNKDRIMTQDEINSNLESIKLLYLFNTDLTPGKYLDFIRDHGTEVNVSGYGYNLAKLADIVSKISGTETCGNDLILTDNKVNGQNKEISLYNVKDRKSYKLTVNENNKMVIIPKEYKSYGLNMLCMSEVEDITLEDDFLINYIMDSMKNNGGYITDRNKLYLFKEYISNEFIRKWDRENMIVSIYINDCNFCEYNGEYYELFDDDEDDF